MIAYLENHQIDRKKWDACIDSSRAGLIYAFSWYLDLVSPGWTALVMNDYSMVMPLPLREKWGMKYVYQPVYTQQLGLFGNRMPDDALLKEFVDAIPHRIRYIHTNLHSLHREIPAEYPIKMKANYELKLNDPYEKIEAGYSSNTRRNITRSLPLTEIDEKVEIRDLIRLKREVENDPTRSKHYEWMNIFMEKLIEKGKGKMIGARSGEELVAVVFIAICRNRIYYLIPVSSETGKKSRAMFAIIDFIIGKYANTGLILDFEGSLISGIARFFAGFGARKNEYYTLNINRLPRLLRLVKK